MQARDAATERREYKTPHFFFFALRLRGSRACRKPARESDRGRAVRSDADLTCVRRLEHIIAGTQHGLLDRESSGLGSFWSYLKEYRKLEERARVCPGFAPAKKRDSASHSLEPRPTSDL